MTAGRAATSPPVPAGVEGLTMLGGGWIWEQNTRPLLEMLALYAGSGFDPAEWAAAESGLADTDDDVPDRWYVHRVLGGVDRLVVVMARAVDDGIVVLRVWGEDRDGLSERIDTLLDVGNMYHLAAPTS